MCELLVRVVDKINEADFYKDCQCTKRGDVITIQEDGWAWGKKELSNPDWRIIKFPGVPASEMSAFLQPELAPDPANPPKTLQRRAFKFDVDHPSLPAAIKNAIADDKVETVTAPAQTRATDFKVLKPKIEDKHVIGEEDEQTVIG